VIGSNDAYGNIGNGVRDGIDFAAHCRWTISDCPAPSCACRASISTPAVHDPLTGETRSFSSGDDRLASPPQRELNGGPPPLSVGNRDWGYVFSLRQDIPEWKSSLTFSVARNADRTEFKRLEDIAISRNDRVDVNWETTAIPGVTLRLGFGNITSPQEIRERTFYIPDRSSGTVLRTERRSNGGGSERNEIVHDPDRGTATGGDQEAHQRALRFRVRLCHLLDERRSRRISLPRTNRSGPCRRRGNLPSVCGRR